MALGPLRLLQPLRVAAENWRGQCHGGGPNWGDGGGWAGARAQLHHGEPCGRRGVSADFKWWCWRHCGSSDIFRVCIGRQGPYGGFEGGPLLIVGRAVQKDVVDGFGVVHASTTLDCATSITGAQRAVWYACVTPVASAASKHNIAHRRVVKTHSQQAAGGIQVG